MAKTEIRTRELIQCPLCEYSTGIAKWVNDHGYGVTMARNALINHLCRKKHGLSRAHARAKAQAAQIVTEEYEYTYSCLEEALSDSWPSGSDPA